MKKASYLLWLMFFLVLIPHSAKSDWRELPPEDIDYLVSKGYKREDLVGRKFSVEYPDETKQQPTITKRKPTAKEVEELVANGYDRNTVVNTEWEVETPRTITSRPIRPSVMSKSAAFGATSSPPNDSVLFGVGVGMLGGVLLGLVPLVIGIKKNQISLAFGGFISSTIAGAVLGLILCIPTAVIFWWLIMIAEKKPSDSEKTESNPMHDQTASPQIRSLYYAGVNRGDVQEVGGRITVNGFRGIAAQRGGAPTAKTTDQKIIEINQKVCIAFTDAAGRRGEHISVESKNLITLKFLQVYETLGEEHLQVHLDYEVGKYLEEGLRPEYGQGVQLFDPACDNPDVKRMMDIQQLTKESLEPYGRDGLRKTEADTQSVIAAVDTRERNAKRISEPFFLSSVGISSGMAILLVIVATFKKDSNPQDAMTYLVISLFPMLFHASIMMVLFYKMWSAIQDGHARTTPGKAVGFLFIPFFNCYWGFQAIWGFAKDYNAYTRRHALTLPDLPEGLFLTYTILCFTGWIPTIGLWLVVLNFFIGMQMVSLICSAVNALPETVPIPEA